MDSDNQKKYIVLKMMIVELFDTHKLNLIKENKESTLSKI